MLCRSIFFFFSSRLNAVQSHRQTGQQGQWIGLSSPDLRCTHTALSAVLSPLVKCNQLKAQQGWKLWSMLLRRKKLLNVAVQDQSPKIPPPPSPLTAFFGSVTLIVRGDANACTGIIWPVLCYFLEPEINSNSNSKTLLSIKHYINWIFFFRNTCLIDK